MGLLCSLIRKPITYQLTKRSSSVILGEASDQTIGAVWLCGAGGAGGVRAGVHPGRAVQVDTIKTRVETASGFSA